MAIVRARVVFPHPDSPTTPRVFPSGIVIEIPSTARTYFCAVLERRLNPFLRGKYFLRSTVRSKGLSLIIEEARNLPAAFPGKEARRVRAAASPGVPGTPCPAATNTPSA